MLRCMSPPSRRSAKRTPCASMGSVVGILGTGAMGSAVARRLSDQGCRVLTLLRAAVNRAGGACPRRRHARRRTGGARRGRSGALDRATRRRGDGGRRSRSGAQRRAAARRLYRLQCGESGHGARDRRAHRRHRLAFRRRRHHRPAADRGRGHGVLRGGRGSRAFCASRAPGAAGACARRAGRRRLGVEDGLCRHDQGRHRGSARQ